MKTAKIVLTEKELKLLNKAIQYGQLNSKTDTIIQLEKIRKKIHRAIVGQIHGIDPDKKFI